MEKLISYQIWEFIFDGGKNRDYDDVKWMNEWLNRFRSINKNNNTNQNNNNYTLIAN